jgi:Uncharacterised nucleotidyltransferase
MMTTLTKANINSSLIVNTPELELLLGCDRSKVDEQTKIKIKNSVYQNINWEFILKIASKHKLLPLLYHNINITDCQSIPSDIYATLNNAFQANLQRNLLLTAELLKIQGYFILNGNVVMVV